MAKFWNLFPIFLKNCQYEFFKYIQSDALSYLRTFWLKRLARFVSLPLIMKQINTWSKEILCFDTTFNNDNGQHTDYYFQTNLLIFWQLQLQKCVCRFKLSKAIFRTQLTKTCSMLIKKKLLAQLKLYSKYYIIMKSIN